MTSLWVYTLPETSLGLAFLVSQEVGRKPLVAPRAREFDEKEDQATASALGEASQ